MNTKPILTVNGLLIAAMLAASVWAWSSIPDDALLPVHWDLRGEVDRFGGKWEALLIAPGMATFLTALFVWLPRIDPRKDNLERSAKFWNSTAIGSVLLLTYVHMLLVLSALGVALDIGNYLIPALAALFVVLGNYLGKSRPNWFAGVRTPWSLSSDYSWEKTHRWAGRMFVAVGLLTIAAWLIGGVVAASVALMGSLALTIVVSVLLSYVYWKNDPARGSDA